MWEQITNLGINGNCLFGILFTITSVGAFWLAEKFGGKNGLGSGKE